MKLQRWTLLIHFIKAAYLRTKYDKDRTKTDCTYELRNKALANKILQ